MFKKLVKNNYLFFLILITFVLMFFSSSIFIKKIFAHDTTNMPKQLSYNVLKAKNQKVNSDFCIDVCLAAINRINLFNSAIYSDDIPTLNDIFQKCCDIISDSYSSTSKCQISDKESSNKNLVTIVNKLEKVIMKNSINHNIKIRDTFTNWSEFFNDCCVILLSSFIECGETYSDIESESILIFMAAQTPGMLSDIILPYILAD